MVNKRQEREAREYERGLAWTERREAAKAEAMRRKAAKLEEINDVS